MSIIYKYISKKNCLVAILALTLIASCSKDDTEIEYADGYPNKLAGNWVAFQFYGGELSGAIEGPYDLVTAIDPNTDGYLIFDNLYNSNLRCRAEILGDTGFYAHKTPQLELIDKGGYGVETISLEGYSNDNPVLVNFLYRLASASYDNIAFSESDISEIILIRAGLYDAYDASIDTVMIMGYRKTGFEDVDYN